MDKRKGFSKGYGFVHCSNDQTFQRILQDEHIIHGRRLDCNIACKKTDAPEEIKEKLRRKVFVGGLPKEGAPKKSCKLTGEDLKSYFSRFGSVANAYLIVDPKTKKNKSILFQLISKILAMSNSRSLNQSRRSSTPNIHY